jgi:2-oxoglutarate dehydrogenase E1 component
MQVCNITTPANYFHALRRQQKRNFRKPLVIMTPKSLLRHKLAVSKLSDMAEDTGFMLVIPEIDPIAPVASVRRVVLCSGKVYYDLLAERRDKKLNDVAILRIEQLYPFPERTVGRLLSAYRSAEVVWCQEEPANMGAWSFVDRAIEQALARIDTSAKRPIYVGRRAAASPSTGQAKVHAAEQADLVRRALSLG